MSKAANPHPGEILLKEFLKPMGLSQNGLAKAVDVPPRRINEIVLASGTSPPTPICGWHAISAFRRGSSSDCRWIMT
jgi:hypothetical protein